MVPTAVEFREEAFARELRHNEAASQPTTAQSIDERLSQSISQNA